METFQCDFCKRVMPLKVKRGRHGSIGAHASKCVVYQSKISAILTRDFLTSQYLIEGKSANAIAKNIGSNASRVIKALKEFGIVSRTISESKLMPDCKQRYESTNLERYGSSHNMNRDHPARKKMIDNLYNNFGVKNVFQRPDVIQKIDDWLSVEGSRQKRLPGRGTPSTIHQTVIDHLHALNIEHEIEYVIKINKHHRRFYDIAIPSLSLLIEVNGDRVHANPNFYRYDDMVQCYGQDYVVRGKWVQDAYKLGVAESAGWDVYYIWGRDIYDDPELRAVSRLIEADDYTRGLLCNQTSEYLREIPNFIE